MISIVLTFALISWGSNIQNQDKDRLNKIETKAEGIVGTKIR